MLAWRLASCMTRDTSIRWLFCLVVAGAISAESGLLVFNRLTFKGKHLVSHGKGLRFLTFLSLSRSLEVSQQIPSLCGRRVDHHLLDFHIHTLQH